MAGFSALWQRGLSCTCSIFYAASARSKKIEFTLWALSSHSLRFE
jgi:hypothetical protein